MKGDGTKWSRFPSEIAQTQASQTARGYTAFAMRGGYGHARARARLYRAREVTTPPSRSSQPASQPAAR